MKKLKKFFKDTWKTLLVIFIVVATLLYTLIFDGSDIPFLISFMSAFVILFIRCVKSLIMAVKIFIVFKILGEVAGMNEKNNKFLYKTVLTNIFFVLLSGAWLVYLIISLTGGDLI